MLHPGCMCSSHTWCHLSSVYAQQINRGLPCASTCCLQASKGARIRQGSPEEEAALASHIGAMAPTPASLAALGELSEALVLLGHAEDARVLQAAMAALVSAQEVRCMSLTMCYATPSNMHEARSLCCAS